MEDLRRDYSLLTRNPYINVDNDLASYFDQIIISVSSLVSRRFGFHRNIICVHAKTLKEATYKLKMSNKVSEESHQHSVKFPIHGTGQGSTASPSLWLFISSTLFKAHSSKAHGMLFQTPDGAVSLHITIIGFVDDSTVVTGVSPSDPVEELLKRMEHDAQLWN